jgi:hypothetical protein
MPPMTRQTTAQLASYAAIIALLTGRKPNVEGALKVAKAGILASLRSTLDVGTIEEDEKEVETDEQATNAATQEECNVEGCLIHQCECDNTHEQNRTVCRHCWARGRRHPNYVAPHQHSVFWYDGRRVSTHSIEYPKGR